MGEQSILLLHYPIPSNLFKKLKKYIYPANPQILLSIILELHLKIINYLNWTAKQLEWKKNTLKKLLEPKMKMRNRKKKQWKKWLNLIFILKTLIQSFSRLLQWTTKMQQLIKLKIRSKMRRKGLRNS